MSPVYKALTLLVFIVLALAGFFILPFMHACLWFVFLGAIFPVSINFISAAVDGTKLTEQGLLEIYRTSLSALPQLLGILMKPFDQGGKPPADQTRAPDNTPPADQTKVPDKE
jgi:hypothetical protein